MHEASTVNTGRADGVHGNLALGVRLGHVTVVASAVCAWHLLFGARRHLVRVCDACVDDCTPFKGLAQQFAVRAADVYRFIVARKPFCFSACPTFSTPDGPFQDSVRPR